MQLVLAFIFNVIIIFFTLLAKMLTEMTDASSKIDEMLAEAADTIFQKSKTPKHFSYVSETFLTRKHNISKLWKNVSSILGYSFQKHSLEYASCSKFKWRIGLKLFKRCEANI